MAYRVIVVECVVNEELVNDSEDKLKSFLFHQAIAAKSKITVRQPTKKEIKDTDEYCESLEKAFAVGQAIQISVAARLIEGRPNLVVGTKGVIKEISHGRGLPFLIEFKLPVEGQNGTLWLYDEERPTLELFYGFSDIEPVNKRSKKSIETNRPLS